MYSYIELEVLYPFCFFAAYLTLIKKAAIIKKNMIKDLQSEMVPHFYPKKRPTATINFPN